MLGETHGGAEASAASPNDNSVKFMVNYLIITDG